LVQYGLGLLIGLTGGAASTNGCVTNSWKAGEKLGDKSSHPRDRFFSKELKVFGEMSRNDDLRAFRNPSLT